jgi:Cu+-exporting ATPase
MSTVAITQQLSCKHCKDKIVGKAIVSDGEEFCCQGCSTVYSIIQSNGLGDYYQIQQNAGLSQKHRAENSYDYLALPDIQSKMAHQIYDNMYMVTWFLPEIHCASCIWILEQLDRCHEGIISSRVDYGHKTLDIKFDGSKTNLKSIAVFLDSIGYPPDTRDKSIEQNTSKSNQNLIKRIGLAGFVFGNIMLFSFPEYLGLEDTVLASYFNSLNIFLASLTLFYSGGEYLSKGWWAIRTRNIDINIPLALGMVAMYLLSIYMVYNGQGGYFDSLAGLVFFLLVSRWYQESNYRSITFERDYASYFPISVEVLIDDHFVLTEVKNVKADDTILVKNNQVIPVDGILMDDSASIDYSFVTGEQRLVTTMRGEKLYAGGKLKDKAIKVKATSAIDNAYLVKLWDQDVFKHRKITDSTEKISQVFTIIILVVAAITFAAWSFFSISTAILASLSVLIIACPCAIAISKPFLMGNVIRLLARHKIYINNSISLVSASNIDKIVFDKTGTLTTSINQEIKYEGTALSIEQMRLVHACAFQSSHPLSIALEKYIRPSDEIWSSDDFEEFEGLGIVAHVKGHTIKIGSAKWVNAPVNKDTETVVYISIDDHTYGKYIFHNQYRQSMNGVVNSLKDSGKQLSVLSGDNDQEKSLLQSIFGPDTTLHFKQDPYDKMHTIKDMQLDYRVCMIGDGLNDSGAFKQSDLGIVISDGQNNFTPSCDVIIEGNSFDLIPAFFDIARQTRYLLYGAYAIAVLYNIIGLSMAVSGQLSPLFAAILMPISSLTIVFYTMLTSRYFVDKSMKQKAN